MSRNKTIKEAIFKAKKELKENGVSEYSIDAEIFMMKTVNMKKSQMIAHDDHMLSDDEEKQFLSMIEKRKQGIPSQYIIGKCEFMGYEFFVDENVLIPRNDTEVLVETVIEYAEKEGFKTVLDMCTGSGCIGISLSLNGIEKVTISDISKGALSIAKKNAEYNNAKNITIIESDVFESFSDDMVFDCIVSNPPYIRTDVIPTLMKEVRDNEPMNALDGGEDGLYFYRKITKESRKYLKDNGYLFFEIGYDQSDDLHKIMSENSFSGIQTIKDYTGNDRVVFGFKRRDTDVV